MRVAVLGPVHPYRGGIAHYTARLAKELVAEGHDVLVLNLSRQYPAALFPGTTQEDSSERRFDVPAERIVDSLDPRTWVRAARRLREWRAELLVVQWWHPYFAASFGVIAGAARAAGVETVFVCHNVLPHESSPVDRLLAGLAYRTASRFVVHARAEAARVATLIRDPNVGVHPHPIYDLFDSTEPSAASAEAARAALNISAERVLLFFGLIRHYKGLDILLDAMPRIARETGASLLVAGECYDDLAALEAQIDRLGIRDHVRLDARYVANEEVPTLVAAADAVVLPYRHATQSGVAQVAYACGRPVITTAVGGIPEVVWDGETGLLVPPEDPGAIADAVARFYREDLGPVLRAGVERRAKELSWAGLVEVVTGRQDPR
ncbi:MAG: glycosyltransferase [Myxococcales bacterium]|nr:glycosyltransferase [Myxococcales bacterium]MCB9519973.1 glycosyltransferase [Myxococcales bacterium]MCB9533116.1 glycosyltransferase [Myxococcales bacterium]